MLTQIPEVTATANLYRGGFADCIGRVLLALWNRREVFDKEINLPNFKPRGFELSLDRIDTHIELQGRLEEAAFYNR